MAVNLGEFHVDAAAVDDLLHDPAGPVGTLINELSEQAATTARGVVHVLPGTPRSGFWGPESTAVRPPGTTKASIRLHAARRGSRGGMYGGVNVIMIPAVFLEHEPRGSSQMYDRYPFMTTGLESLVLLWRGATWAMPS